MNKPEKNDQPTALSPQFSSLADIERAVQELQSKATELLQFQRSQPRFDDPRVEDIQKSVKHLVIDLFGAKSPQSDRFRDFAISSGSYMNMPHTYIQQCFDGGFSEAIGKLDGEIHFLNELKSIADGLREKPVNQMFSGKDVADKTPLKRSGGACFVSLGAGGSESNSNKRSTELLQLIIQPVMESFDYSVAAAEGPPGSAKVTKQTIQGLQTADLVIADLTDANPVVFCELGVRHTIGKPVVHMIQRGASIAFDESLVSAIEYGLEAEDVETAKVSLRKGVENLMGSPAT